MGFEQNLTSEVIMAHDALPNFVSVKYTSNCPGGGKPSDRGKCDNVNIGQDVSKIRHQHTQPKDRQIINQMQIFIYPFSRLSKCNTTQMYTFEMTSLLL